VVAQPDRRIGEFDRPVLGGDRMRIVVRVIVERGPTEDRRRLSKQIERHDLVGIVRVDAVGLAGVVAVVRITVLILVSPVLAAAECWGVGTTARPAAGCRWRL
jgi:hypothetical protein